MSGSSGEYGLVEPFDVDDHSLDGLSPQLIFALGVEWQTVRYRASVEHQFTQMVHAVNRERLSRVLIRAERKFRFNGEAKDGWIELQVRDYK